MITNKPSYIKQDEGNGSKFRAGLAGLYDKAKSAVGSVVNSVKDNYSAGSYAQGWQPKNLIGLPASANEGGGQNSEQIIGNPKYAFDKNGNPLPKDNTNNDSSYSSSSSKSSKSSSKSSGGANDLAKDLLKNDPSKAIIKQQKEQAERAAALRAQQEGNYNTRYGQLKGMIEARRPKAETDRDANMEQINAELANLLSKADSAKLDTNQYYADEEDAVRTAHTQSEKDLARIFQSRNASDSSYYGEKVQQGDQEFEKTLAKLGSSRASQYSKVDADMTLYKTQALGKKAEIEKAYTGVIEQINSDLTKTDWEKEDAISNLEKEYQTKLDTIDERVLKAQIEQQSFRTEVAKWAYDQTYKEDQDAKAYSLSASKANSALQTQKNADSIYDELKGTIGEDGKVNPDIYARLRSSAKISPDAFDKKYGFMLSGAEQGNIGVSVGKAEPKQSEWEFKAEIQQDLASPDAADMSDSEKAQYIRSRGGDPADYGIYE